MKANTSSFNSWIGACIKYLQGTSYSVGAPASLPTGPRTKYKSRAIG